MPVTEVTSNYTLLSSRIKATMPVSYQAINHTFRMQRSIEEADREVENALKSAEEKGWSEEVESDNYNSEEILEASDEIRKSFIQFIETGEHKYLEDFKINVEYFTPHFVKFVVTNNEGKVIHFFISTTEFSPGSAVGPHACESGCILVRNKQTSNYDEVKNYKGDNNGYSRLSSLIEKIKQREDNTTLYTPEDFAKEYLEIVDKKNEATSVFTVVITGLAAILTMVGIGIGCCILRSRRRTGTYDLIKVEKTGKEPFNDKEESINGSSSSKSYERNGSEDSVNRQSLINSSSNRSSPTSQLADVVLEITESNRNVMENLL
jgi:hypothetical protein